MSKIVLQWAAVIVAATFIAGFAITIDRASAGDTTKPAEVQLPAVTAESLLGKPAPEIQLKTFDGKDASLSAEKGKVVLIDFWATWCPPCIAGLRHLNDVTSDKDRAAKGLVVWALNVGDDAKDVKPIISKPGYVLNVVMDVDSKVGQAYNVSTLPARIVVGRDGIVKLAVEGFSMGEDTDQKILDAIDKELAAK